MPGRLFIQRTFGDALQHPVEDGTMENNRGALNVDDEGNDVKKVYLVKDGILESYLHDRISAKHYGVDPTGNGRNPAQTDRTRRNRKRRPGAG